MQDKTKEVELLKHYKNIYQLTSKQLSALEQGNVSGLKALMDQKQLMIDELKEDQSDLSSLGTETIGTLRRLLTDITAMEEKSQALLSQRKDAVRGKITAHQQARILRQAYEAPLSTGSVVNRSK